MGEQVVSEASAHACREVFFVAGDAQEPQPPRRKPAGGLERATRSGQAAARERQVAFSAASPWSPAVRSSVTSWTPRGADYRSAAAQPGRSNKALSPQGEVSILSPSWPTPSTSHTR